MLLIEDIKKWQSSLISPLTTKFSETWQILKTSVATSAMLETWRSYTMRKICITNDLMCGAHISVMLITLRQTTALQVRTLITNGETNDYSYCRY